MRVATFFQRLKTKIIVANNAGTGRSTMMARMHCNFDWDKKMSTFPVQETSLNRSKLIETRNYN